MHPNLLSDPEAAFQQRSPRRVVSLVPSVSASLIDLGLGGVLAGVTDYCPAADGEAHPPRRVGGPRSPDTAVIAALRPDLILANREENDRAAVERLAEMGFPVWLAFPTSVDEALRDLRTLARLFRGDTARQAAALQAVATLEMSVEWARLAVPTERALRCFCPIWEDAPASGERWWMTFNGRTYPSDVLALLGLVNVFAERERRYPLEADLGLAQPEPPGERDTRYPRVTLDEIRAAQPEIILLPDEPYPYGEGHAAEAVIPFAGTPAAQSGRVYTLDGSLLMWHGTRLARAIEELPAFLAL